MIIFYTPQSKWHLKKQRLKAQQLKSSQWWKQKLKEDACYYCQKRFTIDQLTMDHKLPLAKGGVSSKSNVVVACQGCNRAKGTKTSVDIALEKINLQNKK